ncbi:MAG: hypothetical protein ABSA83_21575 [Verrucomicrobiota bacterium]|jgi:hypothetical protein
MNTQPNKPTRSATNAHEGQTAADTNPGAFLAEFFAHSRKMHLVSGEQVRIPLGVSQSAGVACPLFLSKRVYFELVETRSNDQNKDAKLHEIMVALDRAHKKASPGTVWFPVSYPVANPPRCVACNEPLSLVAVIGPVSLDDPQPAITLVYTDRNSAPFHIPVDGD